VVKRMKMMKNLRRRKKKRRRRKRKRMCRNVCLLNANFSSEDFSSAVALGAVKIHSRPPAVCELPNATSRLPLSPRTPALLRLQDGRLGEEGRWGR
jgi:hypothetical protein